MRRVRICHDDRWRRVKRGSGLTDDVARGLKGQLHDALILVGGGQVEDGEDVLPP